MAYGLFKQAEVKTFKDFKDETVVLNTPAGYAGLFWGRLYDSDGYRIYCGSEILMRLAQENGETDMFAYWDVVSKLIDKQCETYLKPLMNGDESYAYQSGFGADECDGLIDFWLPTKVPELPNIPFEVGGKKFELRWEYSTGE